MVVRPPNEKKLPEFATVTLCGSMRFARDMMRVVAVKFSLDGWVVLAPFVNFKEDAPEPLSAKWIDGKSMLDRMHMEKIRRSDAVCIVTDPDHYVGESTTNELHYAYHLNKTVFVHDRLNPREHGFMTSIATATSEYEGWRVS